MSRTGLCSVTFRALSVTDVATTAAAAGLRLVEWAADRHAPADDTGALAVVARVSAEHGLRTCSYGSYFRVGAQPVAEFLPVARAAHALGAGRVRIWAGASGSAEVTASDRREIVAATREVCTVAAAHGLSAAFEYHGGTLTDSPTSTLQLLDDVDRPNVSTYWQPPVGLPDDEALAGLAPLVPFVSALHAFAWWPGQRRRPLTARAELWRGAFSLLVGRLTEVDVLIEFIPDDDPAVLAREARSLRELISGAGV